MDAPSIRQAGITVIIFTIAAKVFGLIREMIVAAHYGTSEIVDVYLAGITIPAMIGTVLIQALPNAFVPLFSGGRKNRRGGTRAAFSLVAILGFVAVALWFLARPVASLTNSGFSEAARAETVIVLRIVAASVAFATIGALLRSRLLAQKRFAYSGVAGLWTSIAMIGAIVLHPAGGARTLAWGYIVGLLLAAAWNLMPYILRRGGSPRAEQPVSQSLPSSSEGYWVTAVILLSSTGGLYALLDRYLASFLDEGSIAALQYANLVASQPVAICGIAIGTAVFPYLVKKVMESDSDAVGKIIDRAIRWVLVGSVPVAVWIGVLGDEIVSILFERGAFDVSSRLATGALLMPYAFWLVPAVLTSVLMRVYYAMFRWRPILAAVLVGLLVKAVLSFWWVKGLGALGLAAATAAAAGSTTLVLLFALPREFMQRNWFHWGQLSITLAGLSLAGAIMGFYLPDILSISQWEGRAVLRVVTGTALSLGLILLLGPRLHVDEVIRMREWILGRLLRH